MDPSLLGNLESHVSPPGFAVEGRNARMYYLGLACRCGGRRFRLSGWPRVASGRGGFFWRTVARVWREARAPMQAGELVDSPFWLPVSVCCEACGREEILLDGETVVVRLPEGRRNEPREAYRCRVCRRGIVELAVGEAPDSHFPKRADYEIVAHCSSCHRQARIAWSRGLPNEQEVRLDVLYGRR